MCWVHELYPTHFISNSNLAIVKLNDMHELHDNRNLSERVRALIDRHTYFIDILKLYWKVLKRDINEKHTKWYSSTFAKNINKDGKTNILCMCPKHQPKLDRGLPFNLNKDISKIMSSIKTSRRDNGFTHPQTAVFRWDIFSKESEEWNEINFVIKKNASKWIGSKSKKCIKDYYTEFWQIFIYLVLASFLYFRQILYMET